MRTKGQTQPRVSVVMTVYNGQRFVSEAIDSILAQTLDSFELLVVNDASTDGSVAILESHAARDARIRVLHNERRIGPYPSANRALQEAQAPFIARMDADDVSEPQRLFRQVAFLESNPQCLLVGSGYRSIDALGRTRFLKLNPMTFEVAAWTVRFVMPMVHPSFCFRRTLPDGEPVTYDETLPLAADYALAARLGSRGLIASLAEPLVRYRTHDTNISNTRLDLQKSVARDIAGNAIRQHYPVEMASTLHPLLDAINRRRPMDRDLMREAIAGMDSALAHDGGASPPAWMRQHAARILAHAVLGGRLMPTTAFLALQFALFGRHHLIPLLVWVTRTRNLRPAAGEADR